MEKSQMSQVSRWQNRMEIELKWKLRKNLIYQQTKMKS